MSFETLTKLMAHQETAVAKLLPTRVGGLLMDMGTGKSRTLIELARLRSAKWDRLFWFCPVSGKETIRRQLAEHTDIPTDKICVWDEKTTAETAPRHARMHVIGIETMSASNRAVLAYNDLVSTDSYVAVDESTYIKGHRSKRSQRLRHMSARCRYRAILTGTPYTQGAVDLFAQMDFLSPKILGYKSFWSFAANHLEYEERRCADGVRRRTGRIIRSHNEEYLAARIAPYVYQVKKDECLTLPDKLHETRWCAMTGEQRELYEHAKEEILLSHDYDDWSPVAIFHLFSALQTIVCGFWNRTDPDTGKKELIEVEHNRLELLTGVLSEIPEGERVIIWCKYHHAIRQIAEAIGGTYGSENVAEYHGGITERTREGNLTRWRNGARFLLATQSAGGHVLTLNESAYSIFYADAFKYSERLQAEDRNHRIGQARRPVYVTLRCSRSIDDRIADSLSRKGSSLEEFQDRLKEYRALGLKERMIKMVANL